MKNMNAKYFIAQARERLHGKDATRLTAFHTGITVAAALLVTVLQYLLSLGIGNTTGLSGMGTSAILQTMQTVLQTANIVLAPFWNLGFLYVTLLWARDQYGRKGDLLTGFSRIGPCIGLMLARFALIIAVVMIIVYASSAVFMMTPDAQLTLDIAAQTNMDTDAVREHLYGMTDAQTLELMGSMLPLLIVSMVLSLVVLVPLLYRFRLAEYAVLNHKGLRAVPAMMISAHLMRRRFWQVLKLDLRLWWYYGLKVLCTLLCYLELLIPLPLTGDAGAFVTYLIYLAALLAVETAFRPRVQTAYAVMYETYMAASTEPKENLPAKPQNMPWDGE